VCFLIGEPYSAALQYGLFSRYAIVKCQQLTGIVRRPVLCLRRPQYHTRTVGILHSPRLEHYNTLQYTTLHYTTIHFSTTCRRLLDFSSSSSSLPVNRPFSLIYLKLQAAAAGDRLGGYVWIRWMGLTIDLRRGKEEKEERSREHRAVSSEQREGGQTGGSATKNAICDAATRVIERLRTQITVPHQSQSWVRRGH